MKNKKLRYFFPKKGEDSEYGRASDGMVVKLSFHKETIEAAYNELKAFLIAEGYEDIPIPKDADELSLFRDNESGYVTYEHKPVSISFSAYHETALDLVIIDENYPNYILMEAEGSMQILKEHRIEQAIIFVEKAIEEKGEKEGMIKPDRLREIAKILLEINYDKITIIAGLLQNAFQRKLITEQAVSDEFGDEVAKAMFKYAHRIF